jgi:hypothetical protein
MEANWISLASLSRFSFTESSHHILLDWCAYIKWGIIGQTAQYIKFICH